MNMRLTDHANRRMADEGIAREDVETAISQPERTDVGETAIEYYLTLRGRTIRVIVVRDSNPPLVITTHVMYR